MIPKEIIENFSSQWHIIDTNGCEAKELDSLIPKHKSSILLHFDSVASTSDYAKEIPF
ncbi:MAG: hypothetical protein HQL32_16955, partial [Planctomycetes bacterium]|nr:hypothetical protein [Planctomycetota bacterium]